MRKLVLLAAAVPRVLAPPAFADDHNPERRSVCRVPYVDIQYDVQTFAVEASLPASGCASREHHIFTLSALIARHEPDGSRDVADWSTACGPFRAASDFEDGQAPQYFCNLGVASTTRRRDGRSLDRPTFVHLSRSAVAADLGAAGSVAAVTAEACQAQQTPRTWKLIITGIRVGAAVVPGAVPILDAVVL